MRYLSKRVQLLLLSGATIDGTFYGGYLMIMDELFTDEVDDIGEFARFIDFEIGGAGSANIGWLYDYYKNRSDKTLQNRAQELKERIASRKRNFNKVISS